MSWIWALVRCSLTHSSDSHSLISNLNRLYECSIRIDFVSSSSSWWWIISLCHINICRDIFSQPRISHQKGEEKEKWKENRTNDIHKNIHSEENTVSRLRASHLFQLQQESEKVAHSQVERSDRLIGSRVIQTQSIQWFKHTTHHTWKIISHWFLSFIL